jgi:DNA-binding LacI/PurR family transcriptional regulator
MFDRYEHIEGDFCHVTQEFAQSSYNAFIELAEKIRKFDEFIFFYQPAGLIPIEILKSFKKFLRDFNIQGEVRTEYTPQSVEKGKVYFTCDNTELYMIIKDCKAKNLILGNDVGLLSHNDEPVKELIADGITTFSTDFALIGKKTAEYVLNREKVQETIPTVLIKRNSL